MRLLCQALRGYARLKLVPMRNCMLTATMSHSGGGMPTRRQFEMTVLTVVLLLPVISMVHLWARKHIHTTGSGATAEAAAVITQIL